MTLIERYLLRSLLLPFIFCFVGLSSLWIIADLFGTLDDFIENKTPFSLIVSYYTAQIPIIAYIALPITILLATLLSLHQLRRRQELTAMLASGISIATLIRPYVFIALFASLCLYLLARSAIPQAEATRRAVIQDIRAAEQHSPWISNLVFRDIHTEQIWFLGRFNTRDLYAESVEILQQHNGEDQWKYFARRASWNGRTWDLQAVKTILYSRQGLPTKESWHPDLSPKELTLNPQDIILTQSPPKFTPTDLLQKAIQTLSDNNHPDRYLYITELAFRNTAPFIPIIFLIAALAVGFGQLSTRRPVNIAAAIFILLSYWLVQEISRALGSSGRLSPSIAAATPVLIFLTFALQQFYTKVIRQ
jgi:lipopolysaccharide export system permease protein